LRKASARFGVHFDRLTIVASTEIAESVLPALRQQGHEIDVLGVGTRLVTCYSQPALNCVYKLVKTRGQPRIKLSDYVGKSAIPGAKDAYRLLGAAGRPLADVLVHAGRPMPQPGDQVLCQHPFDESKRAVIVPTAVEPLLRTVWDGGTVGERSSLADARARAASHLSTLREDHLRAANPTPYKVSVDSDLFHFTHELRLRAAPVAELR
jgi:nicotinate phosphoribosyltransferase